MMGSFSIGGTETPASIVITFVWRCAATTGPTELFFSLMILPQLLGRKIGIHGHNKSFRSEDLILVELPIFHGDLLALDPHRQSRYDLANFAFLLSSYSLMLSQSHNQIPNLLRPS
jgi:hypothetical protein